MTVTGNLKNGKFTVSEIEIQEGKTTTKYQKIEQVPEANRPAVQKLLEQLRVKSKEQERDHYLKLLDDLDAASKVKELSKVEEALRRKADFKVAECYFELPNQFEEAHRRYAMLFDKYRDQPDLLHAADGLYR